MSGIICAIRGGPLSQLTIQKAIVISKEYDIPIYFLYVVNLDFLEHTVQSRKQMILKELRAMGEFICLKAQLEAEREGLQANVAVREGNVTQEIIELCNEISAEYVILGHPQAEHGTNIFDLARLHKFGRRLETETGAKVLYAQG